MIIWVFLSLQLRLQVSGVYKARSNPAAGLADQGQQTSGVCPPVSQACGRAS